ncbi:2-Hydroxyacid oxidase 1-like isoform X1 [Ciona intestinalis]
MAKFIEYLENYSKRTLPQPVYAFFSQGSFDENTLRDSIQAYQRYKLIPSGLPSQTCDLRTRIQFPKRGISIDLELPFGFSPVGLMGAGHKDAELASTNAAENFGTCAIISSHSSKSIEEIQQAAPGCIKMLQLYVYLSREVSKALVQRAERAGFKAIVVTIDGQVRGIRYPTMRTPLGNEYQSGNFGSEEKKILASIGLDVNKRRQGIGYDIKDPSLTWDDIKWLRSITDLPIILKGVLRADDAIKALDYDVDGIMVSTHGGRQLDGTPAPIDALPEIVDAVKGRLVIFVDGGVRSGDDVLKAIAVGADAVFFGRPILWGLAWKGQAGVETVLQTYKDGLSTAMMRNGLSRINDITRANIQRCNVSNTISNPRL